VILALPISGFAECAPLFKKLSPAQISAAHGEILSDLDRGQIVDASKKRVNGNMHDLWWLTLNNPETGHTRQAIMKPREWGDSGGWARAPMEVVAYELNRALGMDYVPPTVYRKKIKIGSEFIHEAPLIYLVPKAQILYETPESQWGDISKKAVQSDHRILCVLLHNSDGHAKNLLLGEHWVDGENRPAFIDFGASLRAGTFVTMRHYPAPGNSEPVSVVREKTLKSLKSLSLFHFKSVTDYVSPKEISEILMRRDGIVDYFERLISEKGAENVVLKD
jgi:hypothetical protein